MFEELNLPPLTKGIGIAPQDLLELEGARRAVWQTDDNAALIHLYTAKHHIVFESENERKLACALMQQPAFVASELDVDMDWAGLKSTLDPLVAIGVVGPAVVSAEKPLPPTRICHSPLATATVGTEATVREFEILTQDLAGRFIDQAYAELIIPVFRIAHAAFDRDGRQIGEANVFPSPLRRAVDTEWRVCPHAGTRYQTEKPMNISAMRAMRSCWGEMMQVLKILRDAYLSRFPEDRSGWSVAAIERFATLILAVPTFGLMQAEAGSNPAPIHPVFSSIFRVTDGLRMTVHQMLFVPGVEANLDPEQQITPTFIYDYAERNYNFFSDHGVCAGPRVMIEEFLAVLLDGACPRDDGPAQLDADLMDCLQAINSAFDYGLLGLQVHFVSFSHWVHLARAYEALEALSDAMPEPLAKAVRNGADLVKVQSYHNDEGRRTHRELTYAALARACNSGLSPDLQNEIPVTWRTDAAVAAIGSTSKQALRAWAEALGLAPDVTDFVWEIVVASHSVLDCAMKIQRRLNSVLGRAHAKAAFSIEDMATHLLIQGRSAPSIRHLFEVLRVQGGLEIAVTSDQTSVVFKPFADCFADVCINNLSAQG